MLSFEEKFESTILDLQAEFERELSERDDIIRSLEDEIAYLQDDNDYLRSQVNKLEDDLYDLTLEDDG